MNQTEAQLIHESLSKQNQALLDFVAKKNLQQAELSAKQFALLCRHLDLLEKKIDALRVGELTP